MFVSIRRSCITESVRKTYMPRERKGIRMKVILFNGSPHREGCTNAALQEVAATLAQSGIDTETIWVGKDPVQGCLACGGCRQNKKCMAEDTVNEWADKIAEADGLVIGSPVYYASMTGTLKAVLDRLFFSSSRRFYGKVGAAVVNARRGGCTAAFDDINKYFTITCYKSMT